MFKNKKRGFTLIELLVVIAVIGLLASIVLVAVNSARAKARDTKRKADLKQIQLALELYYDEKGYYPPVAQWVFSTAGGEWIPGLGAYMTQIPVDPINNAISPWDAGNHSYAYGWNVGLGTCPSPYESTGDCSGQSYDLVAQLENTSDKDTCDNKCWRIHTFNAGQSWCGASSANCSGTQNYSIYMYADH